MHSNRRLLIPVLGSLVPFLLIVVSIAAFIIHNLPQFRLGISLLAFLSGLLLNSWALFNLHQVIAVRHPSLTLVQQHNHEAALLFGLLAALIGAILAAFFCYQGLANEANLPNLSLLAGALLALVLPLLLQRFFGNILSPVSAPPPLPPPV